MTITLLPFSFPPHIADKSLDMRQPPSPFETPKNPLVIKKITPYNKSIMGRREFIISGVAGVGALVCNPIPTSSSLFEKLLRSNSLQLLKNNRTGVASTVQIDLANNSVLKKYLVDGTCSNGLQPCLFLNNSRTMASLYSTDKATLLKLQSNGSLFIPTPLSFDDSKLEITMPYLGQDYLHLTREQGLDFVSKELVDSRIVSLNAMMEEYRNIGIFKMNISPSNLYEHDGRTIASDFKFARKRSHATAIHQINELYSLLSKWIGPQNVVHLKASFSDFSPNFIDEQFKKSKELFLSRSPQHLLDLYKNRFNNVSC